MSSRQGGCFHAMSDIRLECAHSPNAAPAEWVLLEPLNGDWLTPSGQCAAAGWFLPCFQMVDTHGQDQLYKFEKWADHMDGVALYAADDKNNNRFAQHVSAAAVRQVPGNLVFNCDLSIIEHNNSFQATYTTLAGCPLLRVEDTLASVMTLEHIVHHIADAAEGMGLLRSQNQAVHLLLNGSATELPEEAVLWCRDSESGWLQRR